MMLPTGDIVFDQPVLEVDDGRFTYRGNVMGFGEGTAIFLAYLTDHPDLPLGGVVVFDMLQPLSVRDL